MELGGMKYELNLFGVMVPSLMLWGCASTSATSRTGPFCPAPFAGVRWPACGDLLVPPLAIFREREEDPGQAALTAVQGESGPAHGSERCGRFPSRILSGVALHRAEAAYGNVASGMRLDFTVIGPDASRIARAQSTKTSGGPAASIAP